MKRETLDFIQVNYAIDNRDAAERVIPLAADRGMAVMTNVPFGRDRLFKAVQGKALPACRQDLRLHELAAILPEIRARQPGRDLPDPRHGEGRLRRGQPRRRPRAPPGRGPAEADGGLHRCGLIFSRAARRSPSAAGTRPVAAVLPATAQDGAKKIRIGVIGAGNIGGTIGTLWVKDGHEVMFASRHPETLAAGLGARPTRPRPARPRRRSRSAMPCSSRCPTRPIRISRRRYAAGPQGQGRDRRRQRHARRATARSTTRSRPTASARPRPSTSRAPSWSGRSTRPTTRSSPRKAPTAARTGPAAAWRSRSRATIRPRSRSPRAWCATPASTRWWSAALKDADKFAMGSPGFGHEHDRAGPAQDPRVGAVRSGQATPVLRFRGRARRNRPLRQVPR